MTTRTPGQMAYEIDCDIVPTYRDGTKRKTWHELGAIERHSWERNPTPRYTRPKPGQGRRVAEISR